MALSAAEKQLHQATVKVLKGGEKRRYMARVARTLGRGGPSLLERELGWSRHAMRKATYELDSGFICVDDYAARGRKRAEAHLPDLLDDMRAIAEQQSQTDPTFHSTRLYLRLSATAVRAQLETKYDYSDASLPSVEIIRQRLNTLGYRLRAVKKSQPLKKLPETDAIFKRLAVVNPAADADPTILRLSVDAKARVVLGRFSRRGRSRVPVAAYDHDFRDAPTVTPVGVFLPAVNETYLYFIAGRITADALMDVLQQTWDQVAPRFPAVRTLHLNLDNGPENHSRRTQFMQRLTEFVDTYNLTVQLAYYPPYHSKYNPIERVWGVLEQHWNGTLLDKIDTVLALARTMTYKHVNPIVHQVQQTYAKGVKLTAKAMAALEARFEREPELEKYFVRIAPLVV